MTTATVPATIRSHYRGATATLRARKLLTVNGRPYLMISPRAYRAAERRVCYAGTDYGELEPVPGYTPWTVSRDGSHVAYGQ